VVLNSIASQGIQDGVSVSSLPVFLLSSGTVFLSGFSRAHGRPVTGLCPDVSSAISSTRSASPIEWRLAFMVFD